MVTEPEYAYLTYCASALYINDFEVLTTRRLLLVRCFEHRRLADDLGGLALLTVIIKLHMHVARYVTVRRKDELDPTEPKSLLTLCA